MMRPSGIAQTGSGGFGAVVGTSELVIIAVVAIVLLLGVWVALKLFWWS